MLSDKYLEVQENLVKLRHTYVEKKEAIKGKLDSHTKKLEHIFSIYYDTLDEIRHQVLDQEYKINGQMDEFEDLITNLV